VLFLKGLQADGTKARWSAHTAFYEAAVREPTAALLGELGGNSARTDGPSLPGRMVPGR
jgi:hypothetical protein